MYVSIGIGMMCALTHTCAYEMLLACIMPTAGMRVCVCDSFGKWRHGVSMYRHVRRELAHMSARICSATIRAGAMHGVCCRYAYVSWGMCSSVCMNR